MNIEKTGQFIAELRREKQSNWQMLYMFLIRLSHVGRREEGFRTSTIWKLFPNVWMSQSPNSSKGKGSMSRYPEMS